MDSRESVERIRALLPSLPSSDVEIGKKFLAKRDFESLQLLVDSSLVRVKKGLAKENVKEEYLKVDLRKISILKSEIDTYCIALELPEQKEDFDDFSSEEFNEDYY